MRYTPFEKMSRLLYCSSRIERQQFDLFYNDHPLNLCPQLILIRLCQVSLSNFSRHFDELS